MKIGITGSIASGKSTATKILSKKIYPIFSADAEVKKLYKNKLFLAKLIKKFKIQNKNKVKSFVKNLIINNTKRIIKLEKLIHPLVRRKMKEFIKKNNKDKLVFFEIPLLIESKLMKYFDIIIFISSLKKNRIKRYKKSGGDGKIFKILNNRQIAQNKKQKFCDYVISNNKTVKELKKKLNIIHTRYE
jgi:dephospho-CoA kinase